MKENAPPAPSTVDAHRDSRIGAVANLRALADRVEAQIDSDPATDPVCLFVVAYDKEFVSNFGLLSAYDRGEHLLGLVELQKARLVASTIKRTNAVALDTKEPTDG